MSDPFNLEETDVREIIASLSVDQIAELNEDVQSLRDDSSTTTIKMDTDEVDDVIADLSVEAIAERNDEVKELLDELERLHSGGSSTVDEAPTEYIHGEVYSLDSGGDDADAASDDDSSPSKKYESGNVYDLSSE